MKNKKEGRYYPFVKKHLKLFTIATDGTNDFYEGVLEFVRLANKKSYKFMQFTPDELVELDEQNAAGDDIIIVYSKDSFTRNDAKKALKALNNY